MFPPNLDDGQEDNNATKHPAYARSCNLASYALRCGGLGSDDPATAADAAGSGGGDVPHGFSLAGRGLRDGRKIPRGSLPEGWGRYNAEQITGRGKARAKAEVVHNVGL